MEKKLKYQLVANELKAKIQQEGYKVGDLLPSENNLCDSYQITRTTARKALDELMKEGYIIRQHGKGSVVIERRKTLGLLTLKGFSDATEEKVNTVYIQTPFITDWPLHHPFIESDEIVNLPCMSFERIRYVNDNPVMMEKNWFSAKPLKDIGNLDFTDGSFFKTLTQRYGIEIIGSQQEIKACMANDEVAKALEVAVGLPLVQVNVCFITSKPEFTIYAKLICNTEKYPIGNKFFKS